jgi:hypothetical protein
MCTQHWNQYTAGLARDAKARKAAEGATASEPTPKRRRQPDPAPVADDPGAAT